MPTRERRHVFLQVDAEDEVKQTFQLSKRIYLRPSPSPFAPELAESSGVAPASRATLPRVSPGSRHAPP
eukprot:7949317-Pyramimonas_sp.AAC.1